MKVFENFGGWLEMKYITVIVSVYNSENYLEKCVNSLLQQTYSDYEILLINDGSKDNSEKICQEYAKLSPYISAYSKDNGGLSSTRNYGIRKANGKYIVFLDSDDWFEKDMLERLAEASENGKADVVTQGFQVEFIEDHFTKTEMLSKEISTNDMSLAEIVVELEKKSLFNSACNKLYRTQIIKDNEISFQIGMEPGEDLLFNCLYFQRIKNAHCITYCGYHYIKRTTSSLTSNYYAQYEDKIKIFYNNRKSLYESISMPFDNRNICLANSMTSYAITAVSNIYNKESNLNFMQKEDAVRRLIKDEMITKEVFRSNYTNIYVKILKILIKLRSATLANVCYSILFCLKTKFHGLYRKFRKRALYAK